MLCYIAGGVRDPTGGSVFDMGGNCYQKCSVEFILSLGALC